MERVTGQGVKSKVDFVMLFPSLRTQRSLMSELIKKLTDNGHKTIAFSGSHQGAELLAVQALDELHQGAVYFFGRYKVYCKTALVSR